MHTCTVKKAFSNFPYNKTFLFRLYLLQKIQLYGQINISNSNKKNDLTQTHNRYLKHHDHSNITGHKNKEQTGNQIKKSFNTFDLFGKAN